MSYKDEITIYDFLYKPLDEFVGTLKIGTFFSGIGSPEKALLRLKKENIISNYEVMFFCELNKSAALSYSAIHNEPLSKNKEDIIKIKGKDLPYCDLWVGGFPCQDISLAGKQRGFDFESKTRSSLGWEMIRLLKEVKEKPKFIIFENVAGITSKLFINTLNLFKNDIENLGYRCYSKVLNSKDYGIPQSRARYFLVCLLGDYYYKFPNKIKLNKKLKHFLEKEVEESFYLSTLGFSLEKNKIFLLNKKNFNHNYIIDKNKFLLGGVCGIDTSTSFNQSKRLFSENGMINTLTSSSIPDASKIVISTKRGLRIRSLTPMEAFLLMGFSKDDYFKASKVSSKTNLYKQAGNSIVVDVMYCILRSLLKP